MSLFKRIMLVAVVSGFPFSALAYTGYKTSEAKVSFEHWVELPWGMNSEADAKSVAEFQFSHVAGALTVAPVRGAPKNDGKLQILSIEQRPKGDWIAKYSYSGTFVLENKPASDIKIALPNDPYTLWRTTQDNKTTKVNPCTDEHYDSFGDFWYFWSAFRPGCRSIVKKDVDYSFVKGLRVERLANEKESYPEYQNLADDNNRIEISLLVGKDEPNLIRSPFNRSARAKDANGKNFKAIAKQLETMGFEGREWNNDQVKEVVRVPLTMYPYVKEFTRVYERNGKELTVAVRMVYSDSDISSETEEGKSKARGFHYFFENSIEKSAVTIYDGHSGLGGHLDLQAIRESVEKKFNFNLPKSRYQIYFFNSCSSYSYYNDKFFAKKIVEGSSDKKGSKYLDILATGLETAFDGGEIANLAVIKAIDKWAETGHRTSYQELAKTMELDNLFGVNGDEDNIAGSRRP